MANRETLVQLVQMVLTAQMAFPDLKEQKVPEDHQALMVRRASSARGAPQELEVQKEKRVIRELKELQELLAAQVPRVLLVLKEASVPKELLDERERLGPRDLMAREVPPGEKVLKALKGSKVKLVSKGIREIEALWDLLALEETKDQRAKLEKRDLEGREDQKARGALKVKMGPQALLVSKVYRAELGKLEPKDLAEIKVSREEQVHPVPQALRVFPERLPACLGVVRAENDDPFPTTWTISLWSSQLVYWKSSRCLKTWKHPLVAP